MISESDIDKSLLDSADPVVLFQGGSESIGYKYTKYYSVSLFYIPEVDTFVVEKTTINGVTTDSCETLHHAINKVNRLCENSFEDKSDRRTNEISDHILEEAGVLEE